MESVEDGLKNGRAASCHFFITSSLHTPQLARPTLLLGPICTQNLKSLDSQIPRVLPFLQI